METMAYIWQVSKIAFMDTMDTRAHKSLPRKYDQICSCTLSIAIKVPVRPTPALVLQNLIVEICQHYLQ